MRVQPIMGYSVVKPTMNKNQYFEKTQSIPQIPNDTVSFGYSWKVKTAWLQGKLPEVVKGFYGDPLTKKNVSIEHLKPVSKGGKTQDANLVLASIVNNSNRGNKPIKDFVDPKAAREYLDQFKEVKLPDFNGKKYITEVEGTLRRLGVELPKKIKDVT